MLMHSMRGRLFSINAAVPDFKMRQSAKLGDCFEIPLSNGEFAYGQYIYLDDRTMGLGTLVQIFNFLSDRRLDLEQFKATLTSTRFMFPPVFVGLLPAIRSGRWRIVGNLPVSNFIFPKFRSTLGTRPGIYHDWKIWDGANTVAVGDLPVAYRSLELKMVWGAEGLEERIIEGKYRGDEMF